MTRLGHQMKWKWRCLSTSEKSQHLITLKKPFKSINMKIEFYSTQDSGHGNIPSHKILWERLEPLAFMFSDFETTGLSRWNDKPLLLAIFDYVNDVSIVIDCRTMDVQKLFDKFYDRTWVFHNAKFDMGFVAAHYSHILENVYCTFQMTLLLMRNDMDKMSTYSLENIVKQWYGQTLDKPVRNTFINMPDIEPFSDAQIEYASEDVVFMPQIFKRVFKGLKANGQEKLLEIESNFIPASINMEMTGIVFDKEAWKDAEQNNSKMLAHYEEKLKKELLKLHSKNSQVLGDRFSKLKSKYMNDDELNKQTSLFDGYTKEQVLSDFNYKSPLHMEELLLRCGVALENTGAIVLREFVKNNPNHIIADFIDVLVGETKKSPSVKRFAKQVSTYGQAFIEKHVHPNGRIHTEFSEVFTMTGRLSSKNPNIQNIPQEQYFRSAFRASLDDSRAVATIDYSGCELAICAYMSQCPVTLDAVNNDGDMHSLMATASFRIVKNDPMFVVSKKQNKSLRTKHKPILFGLLYGAGVSRICKILNIPMDVGQEVMEALKEAVPKLFSWLEDNSARAVKRGFLESNTITKRRVYFRDNERPEYDKIKKAKNFPLQATNADMIKEAIAECRQYIKDNCFDAQVLFTVHDEIVFDVPNTPKGTQMAELLRDKMSEIGQRYVPGVKLLAELNYAEPSEDGNIPTFPCGTKKLPLTWTK